MDLSGALFGPLMDLERNTTHKPYSIELHRHNFDRWLRPLYEAEEYWRL